MTRKTITILMIFIVCITLNLLSCDLLNRPMNLILPNALFAGDETLSKADGMVQIFDYEETDIIIKLEIVKGSVDTTKILTIPSNITIKEGELSATFICTAEESDVLADGSKEVTVRASSLHYSDTEESLMVHEASASSKVYLTKPAKNK